MRIWWQSSTPLGKDPKSAKYEQALKKHTSKVARPGTVVDVNGVDFKTPKIDSSFYYDYLNRGQIIRNAIRAEKQGYDGFCVGCTLDPGFYEIRQVVDIPVLFVGETAMHLACLLAPKFALLSNNEPLLKRVEDHAKGYGLRERLVETGHFGLSLDQIKEGFNNPKPILDGLTPVVKKAAEGGADIMISTCQVLSMVLAEQEVREVGGIPILDSVGALVKIMELMIDFQAIGIRRSRRGFYAPVLKDELAEVLKSHGVSL
jgi:allantoin racemase